LNAFFRVAAVIYCLLLSSYAIAKNNLPCGGVPGAVHINPDQSIGGFVASTAFVASTVTVAPEASVCERANVFDGASILDRAELSGNSTVRGLVNVGGTSRIYGNAYVVNFNGERMLVHEQSKIYGRAFLQGSLIIGGTSEVFGLGKVIDFAQLYGETKVCGVSIVNSFEVLVNDQSRCVQK